MIDFRDVFDFHSADLKKPSQLLRISISVRSSSVRSATLRFIAVNPRVKFSATNINRRDAEFAETCKLPYYQHLKRKAS